MTACRYFTVLVILDVDNALEAERRMRLLLTHNSPSRHTERWSRSSFSLKRNVLFVLNTPPLPLFFNPAFNVSWQLFQQKKKKRKERKKGASGGEEAECRMLI